MKKVTLELDKKLVEGELLIYKDGKIKSVEIHELLPELLTIGKDIRDLKQTIVELAKLVKGEVI